jgi:hypothetical protein
LPGDFLTDDRCGKDAALLCSFSMGLIPLASTALSHCWTAIRKIAEREIDILFANESTWFFKSSVSLTGIGCTWRKVTAASIPLTLPLFSQGSDFHALSAEVGKREKNHFSTS